VNPARTRLAAFAIAGFMAAVAGALLAYQQGTVDAGTYSPLVSITLFTMTVIGGLTSLPGAMLGAVYVLGVPYLLEGHVKNVGLLSTGVGLLVLLLFLPGGLSEAVYRVRDRFLRSVAARHQIHVPRLVADSRLGGEGASAPAPAFVDLDATQPFAPVGHDGAVVGDLIGCPVCGARIPVDEAMHHAHFAVDAATNGNGTKKKGATRT
jgi:hypothetical protein